MTDKDFAFEKARIRKVIKKWRQAGFDWFHITHTWLREFKDGDETSAAAECTARWEYKSAWIKWYLPMFTDMPDAELERIVVHELSHILVAPIQDFTTDQDRAMTEYSASMVASALLWASEMPHA